MHQPACTHSHRSSAPQGAVGMQDGGWMLVRGEGEGEVVVRCQIKCHLLLCQWSNSLLKAWPFDPGGARPIAQCSHEVITNDSSEGGWRGVHGAQCWTHPGPVSPKRGCVITNHLLFQNHSSYNLVNLQNVKCLFIIIIIIFKWLLNHFIFLGNSWVRSY